MAAPTPVFVHGAGHGAWCWDQVRKLLEPVPSVAVDLPGHGRRVGSEAPKTMDAYIDSVIADIEREVPAGQDVVLVGHSLGGPVIALTAGRIPERVAHLVYVAGTIPPPGKGTIATFPLPTRLALKRARRLAAKGAPKSAAPGKATGMSERLSRRMFCNDMTEEQIQDVLKKLTPGAPPPHLAFEPIHLPEAIRDIPRTYLWFSSDRTISKRRVQKMIETLGGARMVTVDAGHDGMITQPAQVAAIVRQAATPKS